MSAIERRLQKLEGAMPNRDDDLDHLAYDDLTIMCLDCRASIGRLDPNEDHGPEINKQHEEGLAGIRKMAALRAHPDYQAALDVLAAEFPGFVPAVSGYGDPGGRCELWDLGRPGLFERRTAYLARPDIQALIEEGSKQPLNLDPWEVSSVGSAIMRGSWRQELRDKQARGWR